MRQGISPAKRSGLPAHTPAEVGVASLVFIPSLTGFYAQSLDVLALHLASLKKTLPEGERLVWDNGSCPEVVQFLEEQFHEGHIDYLFLSLHNLGKAGVLNWILASMPHRYIVFSDGDILFLDGWWEATLKIFQAFPKAGMVSPAPAFFDVRRGESRTAAMLTQAGFQIASEIPENREVQLYYRGLGQEIPETLPVLPFVKAPDGTTACAQSGHHVFVMPQEVAHLVPPVPVERALAPRSVRFLHEKVEQLGYWQLSTSRSFVYHLGNTTSLPSFLTEESDFLVSVSGEQKHTSSARTHGLKGWFRETFRQMIKRYPWLYKKTERVYNALFRLLYGEP